MSESPDASCTLSLHAHHVWPSTPCASDTHCVGRIVPDSLHTRSDRMLIHWYRRVPSVAIQAAEFESVYDDDLVHRSEGDQAQGDASPPLHVSLQVMLLVPE